MIAPPSNPYAALMQPMVIVPSDPTERVVVADAGSIIKLLDQTTLYRDRVSPITQRADEILVHYGKPTEPKLGWITNKVDSSSMKPVKGPTYLVQTKAESGISAWDLLRLKIANTRKNSPAMWCAPWIVLFGAKYPREIREVTRLFGGKPIKNEAFEVRCQRLFQLILHTEIDMSKAKAAQSVGKKKKGKKGKVAEEKEVPVKTKKGKKKGKVKTDKPEKKANKKDKSGGKEKKKASGEFSPRTRDFDNHVIKRLIQENPRRAGSEKAKTWEQLKKGMTVGQFAEKKGGSRAVVAHYIKNGWVKLLRPSGE